MSAPVESAAPSDSEDEGYSDCIEDRVDGTTFDDKVDRCFIILDIGSLKKVNCPDRNGSEKVKDVYNVTFTTPIGEAIQFTAWEQVAQDAFDWFS